MSGRRRITPAHRAHAVRVAAAATLLVAIVSVALGAALDLLVSQRLTTQVSQEVLTRLAQAKRDLAFPTGKQAAAAFASGDEGGRYGLGIYGAPVFVWEVSASGAVVRATPGAPGLPARRWGAAAAQGGLTIGTTPFLLASRPLARGWLVAGESLAELSHVRSVLVNSEALALPILIIAVFLGSLAIGIRSVVPVEEARRRQLEFTADASHELRTPLSVIEAELALWRQGGGETDAEVLDRATTLQRIGRESARLQRIVEDLLWLARFDSEPAPPGDEPIDLATIAELCADRFAALAASRQVTISLQRPPEGSVAVVAPPEWIDRLVGVLVDNACRYAGEGGCVLISVGVSGSRAVLAVEDSGPGIPPGERDRLFDRFRRATDEPGGHGLGLAIADSVVRSTGGRWRIGRAAAGGARMEVSWSQG
ncbi:MAG TPA: HAMP domain-containing sensor histidine kinase [Acidimicrobiales bacterium]|nr:HAMP domain-containing sensor histidine kinase [Acidimicrobiales bacterium]